MVSGQWSVEGDGEGCRVATSLNGGREWGRVGEYGPLADARGSKVPRAVRAARDREWQPYRLRLGWAGGRDPGAALRLCPRLLKLRPSGGSCVERGVASRCDVDKRGGSTARSLTLGVARGESFHPAGVSGVWGEAFHRLR